MRGVAHRIGPGARWSAASLRRCRGCATNGSCAGKKNSQKGRRSKKFSHFLIPRFWFLLPASSNEITTGSFSANKVMTPIVFQSDGGKVLKVACEVSKK